MPSTCSSALSLYGFNDTYHRILYFFWITSPRMRAVRTPQPAWLNGWRTRTTVSVRRRPA
jgi:hypothetical protein